MSFVPTDFTYNVSRGKVPGAQPFGGFGEHSASGSSSGVIWTNGTYTFPPAAGVQLSVASSSANDASGGTGVNSIILHYLDADLVPKSETVVLNGTTPVTTTATDIRFIQNMYAATVGSGGTAAGNVSASSGGTTYEIIGAGHLNASNSIKMVPAGKRLLVTSFFGGSTSGSTVAKVQIYLASPQFGGVDFTAQSLLFRLGAASYQDTSGGLTIPCPISFTEGQAVGMAFITDKAATITGSWFGWLENE